MKLARFLGIAVILTGVFLVASADATTEDATREKSLQKEFAKPDVNTKTEDVIRYVEIKKPLQKVYTRLDPNSEIIRLVKKGEYIELIRKGESWYEVKVDGKIGYLEAKAGKEVNRKGAPVITLFLYIILLLGCAGGVVLYIKKQQIAPSAAAGIDDDDFDDDELD
jgi:DNA-directed RNA polymerase beta' subunit